MLSKIFKFLFELFIKIYHFKIYFYRSTVLKIDFKIAKFTPVYKIFNIC